MKSDKLKIALECLKGSVQSNTDAVELTGQTARASDGVWWAEATLPDPISAQMAMRYSKLRSMVKTLDEKGDIEIDRRPHMPGQSPSHLMAIEPS